MGIPMYACRLWTVGFLLTVVYGTAVAAESSVAERITGSAVKAGQASKGVVLIAVRWDRRWKCAGFENAQLRVIGFDKLPNIKANDDVVGDIVLDDAPLIMTKPTGSSSA